MNILWPAHLARSEPFLYSFSSTCKVCSVPCCNLFSPPTSRYMKPLSANITYIISFCGNYSSFIATYRLFMLTTNSRNSLAILTHNSRWNLMIFFALLTLIENQLELLDLFGQYQHPVYAKNASNWHLLCSPRLFFLNLLFCDFSFFCTMNFCKISKLFRIILESHIEHGIHIF